MRRVPNPVRFAILAVGRLLARLGLVDRDRVERMVDLAWPRTLTTLARSSKNAVDVAMVGVAVGPAAIAGVGFAGPFWSVAFTVGGGLATGTISLVSQRYGAGAHEQLEQAVRSSVLLVLVASIPIVVAFRGFPVALVGVLTDDPRALALGADYLRVVALAVPFAGLNLVGGRVLIGADDAWTPMVLRAGGAGVNVALNAFLIFGLGLGVVGAALGTVVANALVAVGFTAGLLAGRLPGVGSFPVTVGARGTYLDRGTVADLVRIATPVVARNSVWTVARFPILALMALFGPAVVAAYVISRRVWGLLGAPGWGFSLAASSLVGQSLGRDDEAAAEVYGREIVRLAVATYLLAGGIVLALAEPIVSLFVEDPSGATVAVAAALVSAASVAVVGQGVSKPIAGALDATGDNRWPFYSRVVGWFGVTIPLVYVGATTDVGLPAVYLSYLGMAAVPGAINYYRFRTGKWKAVSRRFRPRASPGND